MSILYILWKYTGILHEVYDAQLTQSFSTIKRKHETGLLWRPHHEQNSNIEKDIHILVMVLLGLVATISIWFLNEMRSLLVWFFILFSFVTSTGSSQPLRLQLFVHASVNRNGFVPRRVNGDDSSQWNTICSLVHLFVQSTRKLAHSRRDHTCIAILFCILPRFYWTENFQLPNRYFYLATWTA